MKSTELRNKEPKLQYAYNITEQYKYFKEGFYNVKKILKKELKEKIIS